MKLLLKQMNKSFLKGPLIDHGLLPGGGWMVGDERVVDDQLAFKLLAKYPACFVSLGSEDVVVSKFKKKQDKIKEKIIRPNEVK